MLKAFLDLGAKKDDTDGVISVAAVVYKPIFTRTAMCRPPAGNTEEVCRAGERGIPEGFSDRWTPRRSEWTHKLNSIDSSGPAGSSPQLTSVKEAR